jgi:4-amino-4-deoxy-L-arabinose transferase-like glycosyltransferase
MKNIFSKFGLPVLTLLTFFLLLGNRPLNEPDEGRYSEVAREMIETGDWLVPHFWYLPHLDKPPMTYWLVAASMKVFGQNEWAVRLPVALAGISGVWAAFCLGCALGGRRVGVWSALILQTTMFYFVMARMLTTDIFLAQFIAWAIYFFWRGWAALRGAKPGNFFAWHLAGWVAIAFAFMTKGPAALAIPVAALAALLVFRRKEIPRMFFAGLFAGFAVFAILILPWFLAVFQRVPESAHYMILGQAAGHFLGTTIKNRKGFPGYYFPVLAIEMVPWTLLLGWLWRRAHWRSLAPAAQDGWVLLNAWAIFTFTLFSLSHAKLPAYILPTLPALAVLLAGRFFGGDGSPEAVPKIIWQIGLAASFVLPAIFPLVVHFLMHDTVPVWLECQTPVAAIIVIGIILASRKWPGEKIAAFSAGLALLGFFAIIAEFTLFDFDFKDNQPLDQIGRALRQNFQPGDNIVCWGGFPQGLPFYCDSLISENHRPYFGRMDVTQVPFEFPHNRERLGSLYLDDDGLAKLLQDGPGALIVGYRHAVEDFQKEHPEISLRLLLRNGRWALYAKEPAPLSARVLPTVFDLNHNRETE